LATPPDIQSAAYGIMRTAIQANMFAMVVACEAWTDKGEDGLPVKDVLSPSLLEIVERGRYIDWEQQTNISMVRPFFPEMRWLIYRYYHNYYLGLLFLITLKVL
jgi:hypothetical protein